MEVRNLAACLAQAQQEGSSGLVESGEIEPERLCNDLDGDFPPMSMRAMETVTNTERSEVPGKGKQGASRLNRGSGAVASYLEPFVDAQVVADFLSLPRSEVMKLVREHKIRGYPYRGIRRHVYRFRLSEVSEDFEKLGRVKIPPAAPVSQRR